MAAPCATPAAAAGRRRRARVRADFDAAASVRQLLALFRQAWRDDA